MKSRGRTKVGSGKGNPGYRTPSFIKNRPIGNQLVKEIYRNRVSKQGVNSK
jgi:hypothetical protein